MKPERKLALTVLARALADCNGPMSVAGATQAGHVAAARLLCTQEEGEWADSRQTWCSAAGVDQNAFRVMASQFVEAPEMAVAA